MIPDLPIWISLLFLLMVVASIVLFHYANGKPKKLVFVIVLWSILQAVLGYSGFYQDTQSMPPRFGWVLLPAVLFILYGLLPKQRAWFLAHRNTTASTLLHSVRLPIEIVLFELYVHQSIPQLMTFEGRNFDIIMGITAPIVAFLIAKKKMNRGLLIAWNGIGLGLILFILVNGILSAELPIQQFAFDQPNRAISYFPFVLLPATVVPIVIWTHISDIVVLRDRGKN